ncbi:response regulator [Craterilacuibacter sp. RT1T]|uniref:response regulator transcription factor n=1 Tax=Craterilacuibacter sp. RT1T TaxID=2942211 RepID=UPI0020C17A67|nr:response regulator [Craterilacuibacter sp. RT1T]MCL6264673.1 response regulator [Craterilacuibacter sp. RT1T]
MSERSMKIHVVDDDDAFRDSLLWLLESHDYQVEGHDSAEAFLIGRTRGEVACLIADVRMPGMNGLLLLGELQQRGIHWPVIFMTGHGDVPMAVQALRNGAHDFLEKPFDQPALLASLDSALAVALDRQSKLLAYERVAARLALLTQREREVLDLVVQGKMNKVIADDLGISIKTVEVHRGKMMDKMRARSVVELVQALVSVQE